MNKFKIKLLTGIYDINPEVLQPQILNNNNNYSTAKYDTLQFVAYHWCPLFVCLSVRIAKIHKSFFFSLLILSSTLSLSFSLSMISP
jgi:hypothetical protein